jgi:hypothetical protein
MDNLLAACAAPVHRSSCGWCGDDGGDGETTGTFAYVNACSAFSSSFSPAEEQMHSPTTEAWHSAEAAAAPGGSAGSGSAASGSGAAPAVRTRRVTCGGGGGGGGGGVRAALSFSDEEEEAAAAGDGCVQFCFTPLPEPAAAQQARIRQRCSAAFLSHARQR